MYQAIELHSPQQVIHLGDMIHDAQEVACAYPSLPFCMVPGNCDGWTAEPPKKQIQLAGVSILLSHGHLWGVKQSYHAAYADARACGAQILLFGHTHVPVCTYENGLWLLNPGTIRGGWQGASYGVISAEGKNLVCYTLRYE